MCICRVHMQCPLARRVFSAVIRLVNAPPAFRIDVVGPDPPPVLLLRPSAGLGPVLRRPAPPRSSSRPSSYHPSLHGGLTPSHWDPSAPRHGLRCAGRADGCLPSGGRARSESVSASCAMVGWALSIGLIDLPFSHWTHVTFKHYGRLLLLQLQDLLQAGRKSAPEGARQIQQGPQPKELPRLPRPEG